MTTELPTTEWRRGIVLAGVGLVAGFVLIGVAASGTRLFSLVSPETEPAATQAPAPAVKPLAALPAEAPATNAPAQSAAEEGPSFDVIRVEPDGASVVAGRSRPGAEVEILRDGQPFARTKADEAGNFALVPPALPPGSHEITLRSTAPDGAKAAGRASAVVVVAQDRRTKPLVAVTAPGRPTAVLSLPDTAPKAEPGKSPTGKSPTARARPARRRSKPRPSPRPSPLPAPRRSRSSASMPSPAGGSTSPRRARPRRICASTSTTRWWRRAGRGPTAASPSPSAAGSSPATTG